MRRLSQKTPANAFDASSWRPGSLPAVLRVLDVREVFDRLSAIARRALPHDLLLLRHLSADASKIMTLARTGGGVSEAISVPMTRALGAGASSAGRDRTAAIMHDIEDYHITPKQAAQLANDAGAKLLAFYHLLPSPDGPLTRRLFAEGVDEVRRGGWTIADDGSLYTLPIGSTEIEIGRVGE